MKSAVTMPESAPPFVLQMAPPTPHHPAAHAPPPQSEAHFTAMMFLAVPLGYLWGQVPAKSSMAGVPSRHLVSVLLGVAITGCLWGLNGLLSVLLPALLVHVVAAADPARARGWAWVLTFPALIACHKLRDSDRAWAAGDIDHTGALMILALKLVSLGSAWQEGASVDFETKEVKSSDTALRAAPTVVETLSFALMGPNNLVGPATEPRPFFDWASPPKTTAKTAPSVEGQWRYFGACLLRVAFWLGVHFAVGGMFPLDDMRDLTNFRLTRWAEARSAWRITLGWVPLGPLAPLVRLAGEVLRAIPPALLAKAPGQRSVQWLARFLQRCANANEFPVVMVSNFYKLMHGGGYVVLHVCSQFFAMWSLAEAAMVAAGVSRVAGKTARAAPSWGRFNNYDAVKLFTSTAPHRMAAHWNKGTNAFLRRHVYERTFLSSATGLPTAMSLIASLVVSAAWHGLSPGQWAFFLSLVLVFEAGKAIYRRQASLERIAAAAPAGGGDDDDDGPVDLRWTVRMLLDLVLSAGGRAEVLAWCCRWFNLLLVVLTVCQVGPLFHCGSWPHTATVGLDFYWAVQWLSLLTLLGAAILPAPKAGRK